MTEYWKSQAKKFCDVCKCWITDNKASVQFHESGKRHKENVGKKINDLVKKATKESKAQKELDADMKRMEQAALKAYMKDVEENPDHSAQYVKEKIDNVIDSKVSQTESGSTSKSNVEKMKDPSVNKTDDYVSEISSDRVWYEAKSEEAHTYYWNIQTNESVWEPPEGYVTLEEQERENEKTRQEAHNEKLNKNNLALEEEKSKRRKAEVDAAVERQRMKEKYSTKETVDEGKKEDETHVSKDVPSTFGPAPKRDPYGGWTTVVKQETVPVDLQLPPSYKPVVQKPVYTTVEPKVKIKEKVIDSSQLDSQGPTSFKKRKFANKGNTRQRFDDDDD